MAQVNSSSKYDLHTHSCFSDGSLSPEALVAMAADAGVRTLALSDHDTMGGVAAATAEARLHGIRLIPAVELSATWNDRTIHVVGLALDEHSLELCAGMQQLQSIRLERAREMGFRLEKKGVANAYEAAVALAGEGGMITRTHFARVLVARGYASTVAGVFTSYLTSGKPGYVATRWAELGEVLGWIRSAGGVAVLAHPQRYRLGYSALQRLVSEFMGLGGQAIEVISGNALPRDVATLATLARRHQLLASVGSDFHGPEQIWLRLGCLPPLPDDLHPVWALWE